MCVRSIVVGVLLLGSADLTTPKRTSVGKGGAQKNEKNWAMGKPGGKPAPTRVSNRGRPGASIKVEREVGKTEEVCLEMQGEKGRRIPKSEKSQNSKKEYQKNEEGESTRTKKRRDGMNQVQTEFG